SRRGRPRRSGGTLRGLDLLVRGYKRGRDWATARGSIVRSLMDRSPLPVMLTESQRHDCLNDDNALDAVAASLAVALLRERPAWFRPPPAAPGGWQREGWIWAPLPLP
ncbi:MAG TPA: hypothetical protein VHL09_00130, partial [Dehalococcoidia bacterium]|nr:hypothetical protein [Dehalococcoidia bacterium]